MVLSSGKLQPYKTVLKLGVRDKHYSLFLASFQIKLVFVPDKQLKPSVLRSKPTRVECLMVFNSPGRLLALFKKFGLG